MTKASEFIGIEVLKLWGRLFLLNTGTLLNTAVCYVFIGSRSCFYLCWFFLFTGIYLFSMYRHWYDATMQYVHTSKSFIAKTFVDLAKVSCYKTRKLQATTYGYQSPCYIFFGYIIDHESICWIGICVVQKLVRAHHLVLRELGWINISGQIWNQKR